jgi:hypothetical protein
MRGGAEPASGDQSKYIRRPAALAAGSSHIPPGASGSCCPSTDDVARRSFKLHAEELELTWGCAEPLRVAHHPATVEQQQEAVFPVQQRIDLFVDAPDVTAERLS